MKLNYENVMREYAARYGKQLTATCYQLFSIISLEIFGHYKDSLHPLSLAEIKNKIGSSVPTITAAIVCLEAAGVLVVERGKGKGKKNVYDINLAKIESLYKESLYKDSLCKKIGTIHGFKNHINISKRSVEESLEETPTALPSASPPVVKHKPSSKPLPKKSSEEHQAFDAVYFIFTDKRGAFEPGVNGREAKAIWELIEKARVAEPANWIKLLESMVSEFYRIKQSIRSEDRFLGKQPFLPSSLNSPGIWPRVLENLRKTESTKPTAEDARLYDLAADAIRG